VFVGVAGMFVAIAVEIARENGFFTGHPGWMYVCFGMAVVLIIAAFLLPGKRTDIKPHTAEIKESFNRANTLTANPTIIVNPGREHEAAKPVPIISPRSSPLEPNLRLGRVWKEVLFRMGDDFFFRSRIDSNKLRSYSPYHSIVAELRNTVGHARNIKAELAFEKAIVGPLAWAEKESNTISLDIGDSAYILLAVYLLSSLPEMSEWRVPVNTRKRGELPGAPLIELTQWRQQSEGSVKLNILHPETGRIVRTFDGIYRWPGNEVQPTFHFVEQDHGTQEKIKEAEVRTRP
jgi:hypothetical protein